MWQIRFVWERAIAGAGCLIILTSKADADWSGYSGNAQLVFLIRQWKGLWCRVRKVAWKEVLLGKSGAPDGDWLPDETLTTIKSHLVGCYGPLETPVGEGIRSNGPETRTDSMFARHRSVTSLSSQSACPEKTDITIFRENTGRHICRIGVGWVERLGQSHRFLQGDMDKIRFPELCCWDQAYF